MWGVGPLTVDGREMKLNPAPILQARVASYICAILIDSRSAEYSLTGSPNHLPTSPPPALSLFVVRKTPNENHVSTISHSAKSHVCRFCMKKHADRNDIPRYCPLELYSPDPARVKLGLCALWDDWIQSKGMTDALRIFVDGKVLDLVQVTLLCPSFPLLTFFPFALVGLFGRGTGTTNRPGLSFSPCTFSSQGSWERLSPF